MEPGRTGRGAVLGVTAFLACFGALTAERIGLFSLTTDTESVIVWIGVAATVVTTAVFAYRGGGLLGTWLVALGPSLAFTLNLFLPVIVGLPTALLYGGASGAIVAATLALSGYALGRLAGAVGSEVTRNGSPEP